MNEQKRAIDMTPTELKKFLSPYPHLRAMFASPNPTRI